MIRMLIAMALGLSAASPAIPVMAFAQSKQRQPRSQGAADAKFRAYVRRIRS
jgi:hypothetical protein